MAGEPVEAVKQGLRALLFELGQDYQAASTAWVSAIVFHSVAMQAVPLVPLVRFREPRLSAGGTSHLGEALRLLRRCIAQEACKGEQGDWKPVVFLFSDGGSIGEWQEDAAALRKDAVLVACGAGASVDCEQLGQITDRVLMLNTLSTGDLQDQFVWMASD